MPSLESVVSALNDPVRSGSHLMKVLRVLLKAERDSEWLTNSEISYRAYIPTASVGPRVRELRTQGFNIKRAKRVWVTPTVWEYRIWFRDSASDQ